MVNYKAGSECHRWLAYSVSNRSRKISQGYYKKIDLLLDSLPESEKLDLSSNQVYPNPATKYASVT